MFVKKSLCNKHFQHRLQQLLNQFVFSTARVDCNIIGSKTALVQHVRLVTYQDSHLTELAPSPVFNDIPVQLPGDLVDPLHSGDVVLFLGVVLSVSVEHFLQVQGGDCVVRGEGQSFHQQVDGLSVEFCYFFQALLQVVGVAGCTAEWHDLR